jgi:hypothetical protein
MVSYHKLGQGKLHFILANDIHEPSMHKKHNLNVSCLTIKFFTRFSEFASSFIVSIPASRMLASEVLEPALAICAFMSYMFSAFVHKLFKMILFSTKNMDDLVTYLRYAHREKKFQYKSKK